MSDSDHTRAHATTTTPVAEFQIGFTRYLDPDGQVVQRPLPDFTADRGELLALYRTMVLARTFDTKAINLQRTGQLGTFASSHGQEAVSVPVASAMRAEDVLFPTYRDHGAQLQRGVTPAELLLYWGGDERGSDYAGPREDFPVCVPIATQTCHAVGVAYAMKLRREPRVAVCFCGDGATSKGDFYEAINAAGVWKLPVVFLVTNNQWAISVPLSRQTAAETVAQKAIAAGFAGEQVDGNDFIAVRAVAERAIEAARSGEGPHLIEAMTYRIGDHTTADDASRYRDGAEVEARRKLDPIERARAYLLGGNGWRAEDEARLAAECERRIDAGIETYLATPPDPPEAMFDHLYAELPAALRAQRASVRGA